MGRVLVTAHLGRHFRKFGHYDYKVLVNMGHEVHIAANFSADIDNFEDENVVKHQIDFERSPLSIKNFYALKQLRKLFDEYHFDIIHCQSPSGGVVTRLAAKKTRSIGSKIIYTPHGFHFYKGAPIKNWLLYYPIEKWMSRFTDCIITINAEDYEIAMKKMKSNCVKYIPGVGIDLSKFNKKTQFLQDIAREDLGYRIDDFILICVGEINYNKHQDLLIKGMKLLIDRIPKAKLLLVGEGALLNKYKELVVNLGLAGYIEFLGYRSDVAKLMTASDVGVSSSRREGLPLNILEAMASGLPLVVTNCRGNRELVANLENGFIIGIDDENSFAEAIEYIYLNKDMSKRFGDESSMKVKNYSLENVTKTMREYYEQYFN